MKTDRAARSTSRLAARRNAALFEAVEPRRLMAVNPTFASVDMQGDAAASAVTALGEDGKLTTVVEAVGIEGAFIVSRFNADGSPDANFGLNGQNTVIPLNTPEGADVTLEDVVVGHDGSTMIGYAFVDENTRDVLRVSRVQADGDLDATFGNHLTGLDYGYLPVGSSEANFTDLALGVRAGFTYAAFVEKSFSENNGPDGLPARRYTATLTKFSTTTGVASESFGVLGKTTFSTPGVESHIGDVIVENGGRVLLVGTSYLNGGSQDGGQQNLMVAGVDSTGFHASFEELTVGVADGFVYGGAVASPDGNGIVAAGTEYAFGENGLEYTQALIDVNGGLQLDTLGLGLSRVTLDNDFRLAVSATHGQLAIDSAGRIYLAGSTGVFADTDADSTVASATVRLNADGTTDGTFGVDGLYAFAEDEIASVATNVVATGNGTAVVTNLADGAVLLFKVVPDVSEPPAPVLPFSVVNNKLVFVAPTPAAGANGNDTIVVTKNANGSLSFTLNGVSYAVPTTVTGISIDAGVGNDLVKISTAVTLPTTLIGGAGNDTLRGGSGDDVLLGGEGDDAIIGRDGQDFLLGGNGRDYLIGREDADILITGNTSLSQAGIDAVMREWTSGHSYLVKLANISGLLPLGNRLNENNYLTPGITIFNDTSVDTLSGGDGADFEYWQLFGQNADVYRANLTSFRSDVAALVLTND